MATKKTATTITSKQIYEKVCAIEKMLKECLEMPPSEKQPYLAAAAPDLPLSVIRLEDAPDFLSCFDETDLLYGFRDRPIMMPGTDSANRRRVLSDRPHDLFSHWLGRQYGVPQCGGFLLSGRVPGKSQCRADDWPG